MAGGRWLVAAGSSVRFFLGLGTVTDSVSGTAKASAQSTSSSDAAKGYPHRRKSCSVWMHPGWEPHHCQGHSAEKQDC